MGLTPLEGLVMGTRSGDVDPALVLHLRRTRGLSTDEIDAVLNRARGLLGAGGRQRHARGARGGARPATRAAELALDVYCYRIRKYVGAYLAALGGVDAIVFTAGVGENDAGRAGALARRAWSGSGSRSTRRATRAGGDRSSRPTAPPVAVLVVPTDEELEMATQAAAVIA